MSACHDTTLTNLGCGYNTDLAKEHEFSAYLAIEKGLYVFLAKL